MATRVRHDATDDGVGAVIGTVVSDAKAYAQAEVTLWRTVVGSRTGDAGMGAAFAVGALLVGSSAITALLVGAILALATLIGPGLATLVVVIVALAIAAILARLALARVKRATAPVPR